MRIGFMTPYDLGRITFGRDNGFESVELMVGRPGQTPDYMPGHPGWEGKALEVKKAFDEAGLKISCIAGFYINHLDPKQKDTAREHVRNVTLLAEKIGVPVVAGFAGRVDSPRLEDSLPEFKSVWTDHARFAEDHGVRVAFETCPMGLHHTPAYGINCITTPDMQERCLNEVDSKALGLEWDASHLICQFVDPVMNIRQFGSRIYHVHAKGAKVDWDNIRRFGFWHSKSIEHCFPGLGDEDWGQIIKELRRAGYEGDLNIEGWHDHVYRDTDKPKARKLEDAGLIIAKNHLKQFCPDGF